MALLLSSILLPQVRNQLAEGSRDETKLNQDGLKGEDSQGFIGKLFEEFEFGEQKSDRKIEEM